MSLLVVCIPMIIMVISIVIVIIALLLQLLLRIHLILIYLPFIELIELLRHSIPAVIVIAVRNITLKVVDVSVVVALELIQIHITIVVRRLSWKTLKRSIKAHCFKVKV